MKTKGGKQQNIFSLNYEQKREFTPPKLGEKMKEHLCIIRHSLIGKLLSIALSIVFFCGSELWAYTLSTTNVERKTEFDEFLDRCTSEERIALLQALRAFDVKIEDELFGKVVGLTGLGNYTKSRERAYEMQDKGVLLRPKTFNEVPPETVLDAIHKGYVTLDYSQNAVRKELLWRRYHKTIWWAYRKGKIDYHYDILRWVAGKKGVSKEAINEHSTFDLERALAKKYFEKIWDTLTMEQKQKLLRKIEKETETSVGDIVAISAMSGGAAIAILGTTVAFSGFAFYTTMTVAISTVAGWLGVTLPFAAYTGTATTISVLSGPVGWCIAGLLVVGGAYWIGLPDDDAVAAFVIQVNQIKTKWLYEAGEKEDWRRYFFPNRRLFQNN